jgi:hypothetical protein
VFFKIETLKLELINLEQDVADSPREHLTIYLLSIIALYFYQWKNSFKEILDKINIHIQNWVRDIEYRNLSENYDLKNISNLRAQQRIFLLHSISSFKHRQLDNDEFDRIIMLIAKMRNVKF